MRDREKKEEEEERGEVGEEERDYSHISKKTKKGMLTCIFLTAEHPHFTTPLMELHCACSEYATFVHFSLIKYSAVFLFYYYN